MASSAEPLGRPAPGGLRSYDLFVNPAARPSFAGPPSATAPRRFHRRLPDYAPTPLVDAGSLATRLGVSHLYVKAEHERFGLPSFKMVGTSWATYRVLVERLGHEPEPWRDLADLADACEPLRPFALASATDGNHGRAVARLARLLGFECRVFVSTGLPEARRRAIEGEGAHVTVVDGTYDDAVARAALEESDRCAVVSDTSWPGYEQVPAWVAEGYSTIFWEVDEALEARGLPPVDAVVVPVGVGALASAAVRHYRRPGVVVLGVEPRAAACVLESLRAGEIRQVPGPHDSIMAGLNCGLPSRIAWPALREGLDAVVAIEDDAARRAVRSLASVGVVTGAAGAAALAGLTELAGSGDASRLGLGPDRNVLVLATEGASDPEAYRRIVGEGA